MYFFLFFKYLKIMNHQRTLFTKIFINDKKMSSKMNEITNEYYFLFDRTKYKFVLCIKKKNK